jgi:hypothetical protein
LFNQPEVTAMLQAGIEDQGYWHRSLEYCVDGCLQAVLDEYVHMLRDDLGLLRGATNKPEKIAEHVCAALSLRTSRVGADEVAVSGDTIRIETRNMRTHYAVRFGDMQSEDERDVARADSVRKAFNSPFWPFVLATTSVGQEGLDFHHYCHAVVHWNLPSNPVDLEQREGRVHRYKNHAVRKNVGHDFGSAVLDEDESGDVWEAMFQRAYAARPANTTDIVPFWVYCGGGDARIERHVPALPLSREHDRSAALSRALTLYRLVFGQPRQEDLVRHLLATTPSDVLKEVIEAGSISLAPQ